MQYKVIKQCPLCACGGGGEEEGEGEERGRRGERKERGEEGERRGGRRGRRERYTPPYRCPVGGGNTGHLLEVCIRSAQRSSDFELRYSGY